MLLKVGGRLEANGSVLLQRRLFNMLHRQFQLKRSTDDVLFGAECCDEITSWHGTQLGCL